MSWSNPDVVKKMEAEAAPRPVDPILALSLARIEQMAASDDPADGIQGRLIQACIPELKQWQKRIERHDIAATVAGAVGIADAFASLFGNVLAAMPPAARPRLKERFDRSLAGTMRGIDDMVVQSKKRSS